MLLDCETRLVQGGLFVTACQSPKITKQQYVPEHAVRLHTSLFEVNNIMNRCCNCENMTTLLNLPL